MESKKMKWNVGDDENEEQKKKDFKKLKLDDYMEFDEENRVGKALNDLMIYNPSSVLYKADLAVVKPMTPERCNVQKEYCANHFQEWTVPDQMDFMKGLLSSMGYFQHDHINKFLQGILRRDFLSLFNDMGLNHLTDKILEQFEINELIHIEGVSKKWSDIINDGMYWKKAIERKVSTEAVWYELSRRKDWLKFLGNGQNIDEMPPSKFYKYLCLNGARMIKVALENWKSGLCISHVIQCESGDLKGVYCIQYDYGKIVAGFRDNTIKIWDMHTLECIRVLGGHLGSVLCLQFDTSIIISGSSDATMRVWDVITGEELNILVGHEDAVLHLRFDGQTLISASKDRTIAIWEIKSPTDITVLRSIRDHRAAVNVVEFDHRYIVSASGDRTVRVWTRNTYRVVHILEDHRRGVASLQFKGDLIITGSSDNTVRVWDVNLGICLRILSGHTDLVRCVRFNNELIVSGGYDGKIKLWDLKKALNPRTLSSQLCCLTLRDQHKGKIYKLQFDEFKIISSSHDDCIIIWDFLDAVRNNDGLPAPYDVKK